MDEDDWDSARLEFEAKIGEEAIKEFKWDLLQTYLLRTGDLVAKPRSALDEAVRLLPISSTAAFLSAAISTEVCLKKLLLEPLVHGLINQDAVASLISNLLLANRSPGRFTELLVQLLAREGLDLRNFHRAEAKEPILSEFAAISGKRNRVVHLADSASELEAEHAIQVAKAFLDAIFPVVLDRFYLCLHDGRVMLKSERDFGKYQNRRSTMSD